jgi:hypothetical protein
MNFQIAKKNNFQVSEIDKEIREILEKKKEQKLDPEIKEDGEFELNQKEAEID